MKNSLFFKNLCVLYSRDLSSCRRVLVRPWPRSDVFCVFPRSGAEPFVVVDEHTNSLYVAEYKKVGGGSCALDLDDLRLICFEADDSSYELVRAAYSDYLAACAFEKFPGREHLFVVPQNCPVVL